MSSSDKSEMQRTFASLRSSDPPGTSHSFSSSSNKHTSVLLWDLRHPVPTSRWISGMHGSADTIRSITGLSSTARIVCCYRHFTRLCPNWLITDGSRVVPGPAMCPDCRSKDSEAPAWHVRKPYSQIEEEKGKGKEIGRRAANGSEE